MLKRLVLKNVGPAPEMELEFAPRVNIITGDNGLGKSFILDVAWWALTGSWFDNQMIYPNTDSDLASISFKISPEHDYDIFPNENIIIHFDYLKQHWDDKPDSGYSLVIYQRVNGTIGLYESSRSKQKHKFLKNNDLWDGQKKRNSVSNGLISDLTFWQLEKSDAFHQLKSALNTLSPDTHEKLELGNLKRVSIDDSREIPTLKMPYGQEIPITHASAGIKRILSFAYAVVWAWQEHLQIAKLTRQEPRKKIILLIDEIETHLHPQWQRVILQSLLDVVKEIMQDDVQIQIIATTHSPLVMASLEPIFDQNLDAWFDLNLVNETVQLEKMPWSRRGGAENWLISEAFDLHSTGSKPRELAIEEASRIFDVAQPSKKKFLELDKKLRTVLSDTDEFWDNWRFLGRKKGWL